MKGLFIPEITAEMFRNGCLESIETLMAEGEIYDIDYPLGQEPCEDVPDIYKCSCGYGWDKSKVFRHHFCPNCGAKVAEGSDKE